MSWIEEARAAVREARVGATGWGYRLGAEAAVEPTVLAALGLLATDSGAIGEVREVAAWLARLQQRDGSLGISASQREPGWPTTLALLLWRASGEHAAECERAAHWLLSAKGSVFKPNPSLLGHDTTLAGWPWAGVTHSWLEPTALAVLALVGQALGSHPRVTEGLRLIEDRAISTGGWNYGNTIVLGHTLRPQPGPSGLALLALAAARRPGRTVESGVRYLEGDLPTVHTARSLCWGVLGLEAWGHRPAEASAWLAASWKRRADRSDLAVRATHALLGAGGARSLALLGVAEAQ